jgi:hypothetical protein
MDCLKDDTSIKEVNTEMMGDRREWKKKHDDVFSFEGMMMMMMMVLITVQCAM